MFLMRNKALLVISILLGLAYLMAGSMKLMGAEMNVESFTRYGYPLAFMYFIGLCEVAGAIGLFVEKTAKYAAICLAILMLGAVGTHFIYDPPQMAIPAFVLFLLCSAAVYLHMKMDNTDPSEELTEKAPEQPAGDS